MDFIYENCYEIQNDYEKMDFIYENQIIMTETDLSTSKKYTVLTKTKITHQESACARSIPWSVFKISRKTNLVFF